LKANRAMKHLKTLNQFALGFVIAAVLAGLSWSAAQAANVFSQTGDLYTGRYGHTATLLPSGKVLIAAGIRYIPSPYGGFYISVSLGSAELYDPASGLCSPSGSLATARDDHAVTLLPNGKVLVAGGYSSDGETSATLASAELYDPATGGWTSTRSLGAARRGATAILLPNGKVLIAGGIGESNKLASAELYDPATGTWSSTGSLGAARQGATATLLANGKVLVVEGTDHNGFALASAELYNPATGTWSATGSLAAPRRAATATLLANGKVLAVGGIGNTSLTSGSAELYDPTTGAWSSTGSLTTGRAYHSATLLPNGKVLVAGGYFQSSTNAGLATSAELYDPGTGAWLPGASLSPPRYLHTATLLADGQVLIAAGRDLDSGYNSYHENLSSAELYDSGVPFVNPIINPARLGDGSFQFLFHGNPNGTNYRVLASPNLATPVNTWSNLGSATETSPGSGQFQFTDHQAANYPKRFYRVSSP
jgi:N-acetylneuraminic acid mutarotase